MAIELLFRFLKLAGVFAILWTFLWANGRYGCRRIEGQEMAPTLTQDRNVTMDPRPLAAEDFDRGDVVAYSLDAGGRGVRNLVGRVVGLPGDRVKIVKGEVVLNGEKLAEGYVHSKNRSTEDYAEVFVPRGSLFILCDNRNASRIVDSRAAGPLGHRAIVGRLR
jgi:signal peptidase I